MTNTPDTGTSPEDRGGEVRTWWLVRLRWGSIVGQVLVILAAWRFASLGFSLATLLGLTAAMAATNAALWLWLRRDHRSITVAGSGAILALDLLQLTALLYFSGGAANPFSVFYLVQITAAAATLGSRWTWFLSSLAVSAYAALFALPAPAGDAGHSAHNFASHLEAMWVALTLAAALTAFFVTRLTQSLAQRDREIAVMREAAARRERLSALTTLAAGAAHELGTPLTTVMVTAGELERALSSSAPDGSSRVREDVRLIRSEVARCRAILDDMVAGSGTATGEMPTSFTPGALAQDLAGRLRPEDVARTTFTGAGGDVALFLPRRALVRAVYSLIRNALDASAPRQGVTVDMQADGDLTIRVRDAGAGMTPDVLARAGEPFFTTKAPGHGLGLGLFLTRSLAEQLGGRLALTSNPVEGTTAQMELPRRVEADVKR